MATNPLIALQGTSLNTAPAVQNLGNAINQKKQLDRQEEQDKIAAGERVKNDELRNLQISGEKFKQFSEREQQRIKSSTQGAAQLQVFLDNNDKEGARNYLNSRIERFEAAKADGINVDTNESREALELLDSNPELLKENINDLVSNGIRLGLVDAGKVSKKNFSKGSGVLTKMPDGSFAQSIPVFDQETGQVQNIVVPVDGEPVSRLGETPQEQTSRVIIEAGGKTRASEQAKTEELPNQVNAERVTERNQGFIDAGFEAADALPVISRGLELLDSVKTGGFAAASLKAKKAFGIESADEAELSNSLGKAVLSQLRSTFGAAFTENEGARLASIEADFGKSVEGNRRLLEQTKKITERAIKRAIRAARKAGDEDTIEELEEAMNFTLSTDTGATDTGGEDVSNLSDDELFQ
jgi:hypothetical protein